MSARLFFAMLAQRQSPRRMTVGKLLRACKSKLHIRDLSEIRKRQLCLEIEGSWVLHCNDVDDGGSASLPFKMPFKCGTLLDSFVTATEESHFKTLHNAALNALHRLDLRNRNVFSQLSITPIYRDRTLPMNLVCTAKPTQLGV